TKFADHLVPGDERLRLRRPGNAPGYGPTAPIPRLAGKLPPASQRGGRSIQADGPPVSTAPARTPGQLLPKVVELAAGFTARHSQRTIAITRTDPGAVMQEPGKLGGRKPGHEAIAPRRRAARQAAAHCN